MDEEDWERRFKDLLDLDLIEDAEDLFKQELCFKDPEALDKIFTELEEKNLYYIHRL